MSNTTDKINKRLLELSEQYKKILPAFLVAEEAYEMKKARLMQTVSGQYPSQALRETAVKLALAETKEYKEYNDLLPEKQIVDTDIKILLQISRNLTYKHS